MHRAKGDRLVRTSELPVYDNACIQHVALIYLKDQVGLIELYSTKKVKEISENHAT